MIVFAFYQCSDNLIPVEIIGMVKENNFIFVFTIERGLFSIYTLLLR